MRVHEISTNYLIIMIMTGWKPAVAYMNNYYRNMKDNGLYVRECTRRHTLTFPSRQLQERFSTRWSGYVPMACTIIHINYPRTDRRAEVEN